MVDFLGMEAFGIRVFFLSRNLPLGVSTHSTEDFVVFTFNRRPYAYVLLMYIIGIFICKTYPPVCYHFALKVTKLN